MKSFSAFLGIKKYAALAIIVLAFSPTLFIFQNCANSFQGNNSLASQALSGPSGACALGNTIVPDNGTTTAYQMATVPYGQTCLSQTLTCSKGVLSGGTYLNESCTVDLPLSCSFGGVTIAHGASTTGYSSAMVSFGSLCSSAQITVTCNNGVSSPAGAFAACAVAPASSCSFNGQTIASGSTTQGYSAATVPFGSLCSSVAEILTCTNGNLSPTGASATCAVSAAAACTFNGQSVASGSAVMAYEAASVPFGSLCVNQSRTCTNGTLSGAYTFASCAVGAPVACSFNNQTIASGSTTQGYSAATVPFGSLCSSVAETLTCTNGTLSPAGANATCAVSAAASCTFNGQSIASGSTVAAYQSGTVPFGSSCVSETRSCANGTLSGSYTFANCAVGVPASCTFSGQTLASGATATGYSAATVLYGTLCSTVAETVTCTNGAISPSGALPTCSVASPVNCTFNGATVTSGSGTVAYQTASVPYGSVCTSENRVCTNGVLNGSYTFGACTIQSPATCIFNGQTIASGSTATGYSAQTVAYGKLCTTVAETVFCSNGTLTPANAYTSCSVSPPVSCTFNGTTIASGANVTGYQLSTVPYGSSCFSQSRLCTNGVLGGTFSYGSCAVQAPVGCTFNGQALASGATAVGYSSANTTFGTLCSSVSETVTCTNGALSPANASGTCTMGNYSDGTVVVSGTTMTCGTATLAGIDPASFKNLGIGSWASPNHYYFDKNWLYYNCQIVEANQNLKVISTYNDVPGTAVLYANAGKTWFLANSSDYSADRIQINLDPATAASVYLSWNTLVYKDLTSVVVVGAKSPGTISTPYILTGADSSTFQLVDSGGFLYKDKNNIWVISKTASKIVSGPDVATFAYANQYYFYYDKNSIYYSAFVSGVMNKVTGATPGPLTAPCAWANTGVYSNGTQLLTPAGVVSGVDFATFTCISNVNFIAKDKNAVYAFTNPTVTSAPTILNLNPALTVEVSNAVYSDYFTDGTNVYYEATQVVGADAASFTSITTGTGKDKNYTYTGATRN